MQLDIFQVDAFSSETFGGNPAAVCPLQAWLPDATLQQIAAENNLSETAYVVRSGEVFELRWFTPTVEVDLCGHATLAAAWVLFEQLGENRDVLRFSTRSGELRVRREGARLAMDFPAKQPELVAVPPGLLQALGLERIEALYRTDDYLVVVEDDAIIAGLKPDFAALATFDVRGVAVTAPSRHFDFVSRWFGPRVGVNEDPVTGSAHTSLAPYWAKRLIDLERLFWDYVVSDTPPPADGSDSAEQALRCLYPQDSGQSLDFSQDTLLCTTFTELQSVRESIALQEKEEAQLKQTLQQAMGDASRATFATGCITWKKAKDSVALDIPRLLKEKPYLQVRYSSTKTGSRRFLLA